jgi:NDP-sugar pyrophosphorylase family protein
MVQYQLVRLRQAGFRRVVVNVHHFADLVCAYLAENDFGMEVVISDERAKLLDTGGGVLHAEQLLGNRPFLVHNVDIFSDIDLKTFCAAHNPQHLATLLVTERPTTRYLLFDDTGRLVGWTNITTGEVRSPYPNIDPKHYRRLAFSGVHVLSPRVFALMRRQWGSGEPFSLIDFYLSIADCEPIYGFQPENVTIIDAGTPETLALAEQFCLQSTSRR